MTKDVTDSSPRIDAHHHLWDLDAVRYPWLMAHGERRFFGDPTKIQRNYLVYEFRRDAELSGFGASVHIQVGAASPLQEAIWVQSVAEQNPGWPAAQVAFCDLAADDAGEQLAELQHLPTVRGVRQIVGRSPEEDKSSQVNALIGNDHFKRGLRLAASMGYSFDLQLVPRLMPAAAKFFGEIPELQVALCHVGSPYDQSASGIATWRKGLEQIAMLPNVVCKLSGLGMFYHGWEIEDIAPLVLPSLEAFGPERCMFGSNFPVDLLQASYSKTVKAYEELIPVEFHNSVFRETAAKFYRI